MEAASVELKVRRDGKFVGGLPVDAEVFPDFAGCVNAPYQKP